jgi:hypothetical protein
MQQKQVFDDVSLNTKIQLIVGDIMDCGCCGSKKKKEKKEKKE